MNLILLENDSPCQTLDAEDRRTRHILDVLMRDGKNSFFVGLRDGRMGKASPFELPDGALQLRVDWSLPEADTLAPVEMIIGLPRPQSARRILRDLPTMGIRKA
ncbi:MAG TPA: 16S rRNA (uracil(1498)-N(3))-methyltransferase, partial [Opitutales bacterium]|nr:16S rRNA (uracil(1498)-N(3))-methyltransferase [Opitutales bacterium]